MARRQDIAIDEDYNFQTIDGDFDIVNSVMNDTRNIIYNAKGDWRKAPLLGVGLRMMFNAPLNTNTNRTIRQQLDADGIAVASISGNIENLNITLGNERF